MRVLANENIPLPAVEALREAGHDVLWARSDMPGAGDLEVLARARAEARLLVTFDKDFGELVYHAGQQAGIGILLFRTPQESSKMVADTVLSVLQSRDDWPGHFSVIEPNRIRMSRLAPRSED